MNNTSDAKWVGLQLRLAKEFGKIPDLQVVLFLIGVQELGKGAQNFSKEEKQDLMHIATCRLLSMLGYYELESVDPIGWPQWKQVKPIPSQTLQEQERMLQQLAVLYFEEIGILFG